MADDCEELSNPITGQSITIRETAAATNGECLTLESVWAKPMRKPPLHYHPNQEERFRVLEGELAVTVGGHERTLRTGDTLTIAAGEPHEMSPAGPGQARATWQTRPALRTEEMMRTAFGLAEDGKVDRHGLPRALRLVAIGHEYSPEIRLTRPPWRIQRRILAMLAPLARVCGYDAVYESRVGSRAPATTSAAQSSATGAR
jgi:mannose-6-phosphate isomerase-like protein (cupin superfamily)